MSLLTWIFAENVCLVHEAAPDCDQPLKRFFSAAEVALHFERRQPNGKARSKVHLGLYVFESGPPDSVRRIEFGSKATNKAGFRFESVGWGLVYLQLSVPDGGRFLNSDTTHNTAKRAKNWARTPEEITHIEL